MLKLGDVVPDFTADSTKGELHFYDFIKDSWAILVRTPSVREMLFYQINISDLFLALLWKGGMLLAWTNFLLFPNDEVHDFMSSFFVRSWHVLGIQNLIHTWPLWLRIHAVFSSCRLYSSLHHRYWILAPAVIVSHDVVQKMWTWSANSAWSADTFKPWVLQCPHMLWRTALSFIMLVLTRLAHLLSQSSYSLEAFTGASPAQSPDVLSGWSVLHSCKKISEVDSLFSRRQSSFVTHQGPQLIIRIEKKSIQGTEIGTEIAAFVCCSSHPRFLIHQSLPWKWTGACLYHLHRTGGCGQLSWRVWKKRSQSGCCQLQCREFQ